MAMFSGSEIETDRPVDGADDHAPLHRHTSLVAWLCVVSILIVTAITWRVGSEAAIEHARLAHPDNRTFRDFAGNPDKA